MQNCVRVGEKCVSEPAVLAKFLTPARKWTTATRSPLLYGPMLYTSSQVVGDWLPAFSQTHSSSGQSEGWALSACSIKQLLPAGRCVLLAAAHGNPSQACSLIAPHVRNLRTQVRE
jgi:hypothetical protein